MICRSRTNRMTEVHKDTETQLTAKTDRRAPATSSVEPREWSAALSR